MPTLSLPPLTLYVHIPWCVQKCPYCDFNSHAVVEQVPEKNYIDALLNDLEYEIDGVQGRKIESMFIGGGTPSLFSAKAMQQLLNGIRTHLTLTDDCEITLEANPGTADADNFSGYHAAGINRLSIGVQSFNNGALKALGRIHDRDQAIQAYQIARTAGFDNINLDLMFGLPNQDMVMAQADLQQAIDLGPEHISYYQLTLEPHTHFHHHPPPLPEDDLIADMHERGQAQLQRHGYAQYEVSAYARAGRQCRHNLNYWHFGDYLGIGAGAHGKVTHCNSGKIQRHRKQRKPSDYLAATPSAYTTTDTLRPADLKLEFMMNALRLNAGVSQELFAQRTGLSYAEIEEVVQEAVTKGWLNADGHLSPTETGRRFLNDLLTLFITD